GRGDAPEAVRPSRTGGRPAAFLDRDGTIIEHVHYLADPGLVRLLPGAAEAIRRLREAGFACVVVTNQSAIGRGMLTDEGLGLIHDEMNRQLAAEGAAVDAIYYCPDAPAVDDRAVVELADRKPGPGMLFRAAERLGLDLDASWMVGDLISDVLAGVNAGCRGNVLLGAGGKPGDSGEGDRAGYHGADDLLAAARWIVAAVAPDLPKESRR
ncbi:MAG: HAD family hydrolase, partial [Planctomycetia bacterium]|nr:HAD family hydrolase [Planctomycetia bacterium]